MNIVHLNTHDWYGGASIVAYRLAEKQNLSGHYSRILCGYKVRETDISLSFPIENDKEDEKFLNGWVYNNLKGSAKLPDHHWIKNADILNIHNLHGGYFNYNHLSALSRTIPTVWTLHDMQSFTGRCAHSFDCERWRIGCGVCPKLNYYPPVEKDLSDKMLKQKHNIYQNANLHLICPSIWLQKKIECSILQKAETTLIYNGVDENIYSPYPNVDKSIYNLPEDALLIGFLAHGGVKNPYKGGSYLLEVVKKLRNLYPKTFFLEIGGDTKDEKLPDNFIKAVYTKEEKEIAKFYNSIDFLIYPAVADNCPLVVLEAMACGTPIVCFPTGGIPELIENGTSGIITKNTDSDNLLKACSIMIQSEKLRNKFRIESRKRILKHFTLKKQADSYEKLYNEVLDSKVSRC